MPVQSGGKSSVPSQPKVNSTPPRMPVAEKIQQAPKSEIKKEDKLTDQELAWANGIMELSQTVTAPLLVYGSILPEGKQQDIILADVAASNIHVPNIAPQMAKLGTENDHVGKVLTMISVVTPVMALISTTLPLVAQVMVNHGKAQAMPIAGTVEPEMLASQVKQELVELAIQQQQMQMEAMQKQAALQAEMQQMQEAMSANHIAETQS